MTPQELKFFRERYAYIPARLVRVSDGGEVKLPWKTLCLKMSVPQNWNAESTEAKSRYSSVALDDFHQALLTSENVEDILHGLLSVVFWGFVSGAKGGVTPNFALARAERVAHGTRKQEIIAHLKQGRQLLEETRIADAMLETEKIKFLGMSFASKVLTFMDPRQAAVYDTKISESLQKQAAPKLRSLFISTKKAGSEKAKLRQAKVYAEWCQWCSKKASALDVSTSSSWLDWDRTSRSWRAVDVERAFFSLHR
jgi:hypothetical protein